MEMRLPGKRLRFVVVGPQMHETIIYRLSKPHGKALLQATDLNLTRKIDGNYPKM